MVDFSAYTEQGIRKHNEDSLSVVQLGDHVLAIVADGLGGYGGGDIASSKAVQIISSEFVAVPYDADRLGDSILLANSEIVSMQTEDNAMQTTVAVLLLQENTATALHVGDSRIYQIRDGRIIFQSVDHSMAQIAVTVGQCLPEQLREHPDQNKLHRSLGNKKPPKIDVATLDVAAGDVFLLCSDGFWGPVLETVMLQMLENTASMDSWLITMREIARKHSKDNHTAIALRVVETG